MEETREGRLTLLATEHRAAHGSEGETGCLEEAAGDITAGVPDMDYDLLNSYIHASFEASQRTPPVVEAFSAWSACMADRGLDYPTPTEASADERWTQGEGDPSTEEIEVATADVACKEDASVVEVWGEAEAATQEGLIEEHPEDFSLFAQVREVRLETARTVLERFGS